MKDRYKKVQTVKKEQMKEEIATTVPLISIVVPIYNVERYVRKCLDSLKAQTMKQIEIICCDDGSTDESGRIADEYVEDETWPRFRAIHTENRGLSAARNRGIDEAVADWIMFVDSDDWVDKDFCRVPWEAKEAYRADLVIFGSYSVTRSRMAKKRNKAYDSIGLLNEMTAHEYGGNVAWNKLYNKKLFVGIRYPEGHVYEDVATTHKLVHKAGRIVMINDQLYYHLWRKDSISHTQAKQRKMDGAISAWGKYCDLLEYGYPEEKLKTFACSAAIGILANTNMESDSYLKAREIIDSIDNFPKAMWPKKKIALFVWKVNPQLFYLLCRVTGRSERRF